MIELLSIFSAASGLGSLSDIWAAIVHDFSNIGSPAALAAFGQVVLILSLIHISEPTRPY